MFDTKWKIINYLTPKIINFREVWSSFAKWTQNS